MDWTGCDLVRSDPQFVSGAPALKSHPRIMVEPLIENVEGGVAPEEVARLYRVPLNEVLGVYKFYKSRNHKTPRAS